MVQSSGFASRIRQLAEKAGFRVPRPFEI